MAKPDPEIYALAARRLGVEPHEVVFLDDAQKCVDGARAAGWHAVLHVDTADVDPRAGGDHRCRVRRSRRSRSDRHETS